MGTKTYDKEVADMCKAIREKNDEELGRIAASLFADFLNNHARMVELIDSMDSRLITLEDFAVKRKIVYGME